jgi:hypothetical protein
MKTFKHNHELDKKDSVLITKVADYYRMAPLPNSYFDGTCSRGGTYTYSYTDSTSAPTRYPWGRTD